MAWRQAEVLHQGAYTVSSRAYGPGKAGKTSEGRRGSKLPVRERPIEHTGARRLHRQCSTIVATSTGHRHITGNPKVQLRISQYLMVMLSSDPGCK